jgi:hypothetical protein
MSDLEWQADIDSLAFRPAGHVGLCVIHRRAFGTLIGHSASPAECIDYFNSHRAQFEQAASAKIMRASLRPGANFHLTSRDIARA